MEIKGGFGTRRPFPRWRGIATGLGRAALDGPGFRRILYGVLVAADVPDTPQLRAEAALLCFFASAFASHRTAARVWRVPATLPPGEDVTVPEVGHRLRRAGVTCRVRPVAQVAVVGGVRVSTLPDLFVELASLLPLVELVVVGDWMVRRHRVRPAALIEARDPDCRRRSAAPLRPVVARVAGDRGVRRSAPCGAGRAVGAGPDAA